MLIICVFSIQLFFFADCKINVIARCRLSSIVTISFDVCRFIFKCKKDDKVPILLCFWKSSTEYQNKNWIGKLSTTLKAASRGSSSGWWPCPLHTTFRLYWTSILLCPRHVGCRHGEKTRLPTSSDIGLKFHSLARDIEKAAALCWRHHAAASSDKRQQKMNAKNMFSLCKSLFLLRKLHLVLNSSFPYKEGYLALEGSKVCSLLSMKTRGRGQVYLTSLYTSWQKKKLCLLKVAWKVLVGCLQAILFQST